MIKLRDYTLTDIERLVTLVNSKQVSQFLVYTFPYPYTMEDAVYWINEGSKLNGEITKVIEYEDEFVGSVAFSPQIGWRDHCAEIGYWVGEKYWAKGIATHALGEMTKYIFSTYNISKLFAPVLEPNKASMRVLEKNNYELEGIQKKEVRKDGKIYDVYRYTKFNV